MSNRFSKEKIWLFFLAVGLVFGTPPHNPDFGKSVTQSSCHKGKTLVEEYEEERAKVIRKNISKGTKKAMSDPKIREKISKTWFKKGRPAPPHTQTKKFRDAVSKRMKNKVVSEETRQKLREFNTRKKWSKQSIEKLSNTLKKKVAEGKQKGLLKKNQKAWNKGIGDYIKGKKNPAWKGGISFKPYNPDFNKELRKLVRERDNHSCKICRIKNAKLKYLLTVHHIDYNKQNNEPANLVSLCKSCHAKTNFNRDNWVLFFSKELK